VLLCLWAKVWLVPALAVGAIAIEAPPEDREVAQGAIDSCNEALGQPSCRLGAPDEASAAYYVRVAFFDAAKLEAQVEIRDRPESDAKIAVRHVAFSPADDLRQRYRALGLVVAAYVVGNPAVSEEPPPVAKPTPPPPSPSPEPEPPDEPLPSVSGGADLGGLVGAGLNRGAPRFGVLLRGFVRFGELPLLPMLGVRLAYRADRPALYWLSGDAGLAVELTPHESAFGVAVRGAFVVERLIAQAENDDGASDSGAKTRVGGRLGVDLFLRLAPGFWLFGGGDASLLTPRVELDVAGAEVGEDPRLGWSGSIGLRVAP
jgi:hypothetical protein